MTDKEKIMQFKKYMRDNNFEEERIKYNSLVVETLVQEVLAIFNQGLENIDTYSFEEFTDMVRLIDDKFGGRDGISRMLEAMKDLTEFLKINKLIKGGKIAHYKRMFSDTAYYLDKYDMITGRKDDTKEYIRNITINRFSSQVIRLADEVNVYEFETLEKIEKILNDVPFSRRELDDEIKLLKCMLMDLKLYDEKNGQNETTKKGRALSRLAAEDRYGALIYLMFFNVNWDNVMNLFGKEGLEVDFKNMLNIISSVFSRNKEVEFSTDSIREMNEQDILLEISSDRFRVARIESLPLGYRILNTCFIGMGLMENSRGEKGEIIYKATNFGQQIFKLAYNENAWQMKTQIESIRYMIRDRKYDKAEIVILQFLSTFGGNVVVWDYFGQLLMLKKNYKYAYTVLKHAYENSSKRGKVAKSVLYHLVLCCRKLKLKDDIQNYEDMLKIIEKA